MHGQGEGCAPADGVPTYCPDRPFFRDALTDHESLASGSLLVEPLVEGWESAEEGGFGDGFASVLAEKRPHSLFVLLLDGSEKRLDGRDDVLVERGLRELLLDVSG
jgi:hypothetical protein